MSQAPRNTVSASGPFYHSREFYRFDLSALSALNPLAIEQDFELNKWLYLPSYSSCGEP
jgi:hypothetical protein